MALDDDTLDQLYGLPLKEFVPARNELAKALDRAGDGEAAELVRALPKPSLAAWAVNQLVRRRRDLVDDLLAAVDRVRAAQLGALEGLEDAASLPETMKEERIALARLEDAAPTILQEAGYVASKATIDRAVRALRAAAADPDGRPQVERGRLDGELEPAGFDSLTAHIDQNAPPRPEARRKRDTIDLEMEAHRRLAALKKAEQEERRRIEDERRVKEERQHALRKKVDQVTRTLETAREAETRFEREIKQAQRERQEAERRLREAERILAQTEEGLAEARSTRAESETQLEALRAELRSL